MGHLAKSFYMKVFWQQATAPVTVQTLSERHDIHAFRLVLSGLMLSTKSRWSANGTAWKTKYTIKDFSVAWLLSQCLDHAKELLPAITVVALSEAEGDDSAGASPASRKMQKIPESPNFRRPQHLKNWTLQRSRETWSLLWDPDRPATGGLFPTCKLLITLNKSNGSSLNVVKTQNCDRSAYVDLSKHAGGIWVSMTFWSWDTQTVPRIHYQTITLEWKVVVTPNQDLSAIFWPFWNRWLS